MAEPDAIIELPREVAVDVRGAAPALFLFGKRVVTRLRADERAMLIDSAPLPDDHEPAGRVGDLPTLEQRRI